MACNLDAKDSEEWRKDARIQQQEYYLGLSDRTWDRYTTKDELTYLRCKIAYATFGPPTSYKEAEDELSGYTVDQKKEVEKICNTIVSVGTSQDRKDEVLVAFIFVCIKFGEHRSVQPVFRVLKEIRRSDDVSVYVDTSCRTYDGWQDYLKNNTLPKCLICYPTRGWYCGIAETATDAGKVDVSYGSSPACSLGSQLATVADVGGIVASTFSAGVLIVSFFTPVGPVVGTISAIAALVSAVYGGGRSAGSLIDRSSHGQSISPLDPDARAAWIGVIGSLFGVAAGGATTAMTTAARSGHVFNTAGRIAVTALNWGSLTINGIGLASGLANLVDRSQHGELTTLDVYQFSLSVLFFTNGVVNVKTAGSIIKSTQHEVLDGYQSRLNGEQEKAAFRRVLEQTRGSRVMHGNGRVIKSIIKIKNFDQFYRHLVTVFNNADPDTEVVYTASGLIRINDQLEIHPSAFREMSPGNQRKAIVEAGKFAQATRSMPPDSPTFLEEQNRFLKAIKQTCQEERITFELQRNIFMKEAAEAFGANDLENVKINGREIFRNMQPFEKDRLASVLANAGRNYDKTMIEIAKVFAERQGCKSPGEFSTFVEFASRYINDNTKPARNQSKVECRTELMKALKDHRSPQFQALDKEFSRQLAKVRPINEDSLYKFQCNKAATYHYVKHNEIGGREVDVAGYFEIATELFGNEINKQNTRMTQEGDKVKMTFIDKQRGIMGVLISHYPLANDNSQMYVCTVYYDRRLLSPTDHIPT